MSADSLVRMANQIAASVPDPDHAPQQTAEHLRAFWAPAMIDDLADLADREPDRLTATVHAALRMLVSA